MGGRRWNQSLLEIRSKTVGDGFTVMLSGVLSSLPKGIPNAVVNTKSENQSMSSLPPPYLESSRPSLTPSICTSESRSTDIPQTSHE